ncbi:cyclic nucleotide-binding domain-containing protein [Lampropedia cohaerens]|uniref:cyclic nucleotide-binding domain-containing protein n=1 Tax=Lampropedia cohaerens TaxID=1610491 RepID=UPI00069B350B|nr:cyclic nucleotide-binding domain-containing protein [Lampropedia cohaerens]
MWWNKRHRPPAARPLQPQQQPLRLSGESLLLSQFDSTGDAELPVVPWQRRARSLGARPLRPERGLALLQAAWSHQGPSQPFGRDDMAALAPFLQFQQVPAEREVVQQGEYGDFMLVQLSGVMGVERQGADGAPQRMAETHVGDFIGEMSLLDQGQRFSSCVTLTTCDLAVLTREGLDGMLHNQPQLAARLVMLLARKLSVRLRAVSASLRR